MLMFVMARSPEFVAALPSGMRQLRRLQPLPEPLLQGGEADQDGIGGRQAM
jgi:hypothetical protein